MITASIVNANTIISWLGEAEARIRDQSDYLTQLDAAIGDGDHGTNMRRGFDAVGKALAGQGSSSSPGQLLILSGKTLVATVGGASGPLWGSALRRAGRALGEAAEFDGARLAGALDAAAEAVIELGAAAAGDKTMLDALLPASAALHGAVDSGLSLEDSVKAAAHAAREGAEATVPMRARKGRASYLGERSIGHQDPGATSAAIILEALSHAVCSAPGSPD